MRGGGRASLDDDGGPVPADGESIGRLEVRGPSLFDGYLRLPDVTAARIPLHVLWPRTRFLPYRLRVTIDALLAAIPPLLQEQS